jgi:hypothetical protein
LLNDKTEKRFGLCQSEHDKFKEKVEQLQKLIDTLNNSNNINNNNSQKIICAMERDQGPFSTKYYHRRGCFVTTCLLLPEKEHKYVSTLAKVRPYYWGN